ncbi:oligosaccharide flippase family protein [Hydrogenimonas urashimensis]|uniref:oligosaccharide flippase family protein n=1 Tax=Hydrogenimonas urashimensis TaxID=2740515 RepID=UPI00191636A8|nr:oligosaccharide flippase family protein [Hydrogenimonas urashimensis]
MIKIAKDKRQLLANFFSLSVLQGANFILPLITLPYLVRILGTEKFGLVAFAQAFIMYFNIFVDYGFNLSATREISVHKENQQKIMEIFSAVMTLKIMLLFFSFLVLLFLTNVFSKFASDRLLYLLTFGVVIGQAIFPIWFFQGIEKMKYITILNILAKLIFTIAIFLFVKEPNNYLFVPILNSLGFIIAGILSLFIIKFIFHIHWIYPKRDSVVRLFKESTHLFISNLSVTLFSVSNTFILGILTNNTMVGIYASIEKVIVAIKNLYVPLYQALFPWLSKKDPQNIRMIIKKMVPLIFAVSFIIFLILFVFAEDILSLLYNNNNIIKYSYIFKLFAMISIFASLNMLFNMLYLTSIKAYKERMSIMLKSGFFSIVTTFTCTFIFGITGTAISAVSTEFLLLILGGTYYLKAEKNV